MKIYILGGTGFIGRSFISALLERGHEIHALIRPGKKSPLPSQVSLVEGDARYPGEWQKEIAGKDAVVNLAGVPIDPPWTARTKQLIYESRVTTTRNVVDAMSGTESLINASAIGYYGYCQDEILEETGPSGRGFLAAVCKDWEARATAAAQKKAKVTILRFGIVLGYGGILEKLARMLYMFFGSRIGSGKQWLSWVHIEDAVDAMLFCLEGKEGAYNISSPNPVRNQEIMRVLARLLQRTGSLPMPATFLKMALGEFAGVLLEGQRVHPARLLSEGFSFRYPRIEAALEHLLAKGVLDAVPHHV